MSEKAFPTGAVLSIVIDRLVSENHIDGVYEVLNWMSGESLYTHQLPRVGDEAKPLILALHPELADAVAEADQVSGDNWRDWLATWKQRYGSTITVPKMTIAHHERIDPLAKQAIACLNRGNSIRKRLSGVRAECEKHRKLIDGSTVLMPSGLAYASAIRALNGTDHG